LRSFKSWTLSKREKDTTAQRRVFKACEIEKKVVNKKTKVPKQIFWFSKPSFPHPHPFYFSTASLTPGVYNYKETILKALRGEARAAPAPGLRVRVVDDLEAGLDQLLLEVDRRAADEVERDRVDSEQRASFFFFIAAFDGPFLAERPVPSSGPCVVEREDVGEARAASCLDGQAEDGAASSCCFVQARSLSSCVM
jgi:hypothetical protein